VDDTRLTPAQTTRLANASLTYPEVGATRGELPTGYAHVAREGRLGVGEETFTRASEALFGGELQRRAGVRVLPSSPTVVEGGDAILLLGFGRLAIPAPVRVVYVVNEPRVRGFAYGTLPGHPESGEEAFLVELRPDDVVVCRVTAFSRPVTWLSRLGGPLATLTQRWVTGRYLRSLAQ
jgi:uncharacterized protein (UPF0548 family)